MDPKPETLHQADMVDIQCIYRSFIHPRWKTLAGWYPNHQEKPYRRAFHRFQGHYDSQLRSSPFPPNGFGWPGCGLKGRQTVTTHHWVQTQLAKKQGVSLDEKKRRLQMWIRVCTEVYRSEKIDHLLWKETKVEMQNPPFLEGKPWVFRYDLFLTYEFDDFTFANVIESSHLGIPNDVRWDQVRHADHGNTEKQSLCSKLADSWMTVSQNSRALIKHWFSSEKRGEKSRPQRIPQGFIPRTISQKSPFWGACLLGEVNPNSHLLQPSTRIPAWGDDPNS